MYYLDGLMGFAKEPLSFKLDDQNFMNALTLRCNPIIFNQLIHS